MLVTKDNIIKEKMARFSISPIIDRDGNAIDRSSLPWNAFDGPLQRQQ